MSDATCPRCGRATADGWCGYCLAWCEQTAGDPPKPPAPGKPRVVSATERAVRAVERMAAEPLPSPAPCRSCGAMLRWVRTRAGKAMPLDAEPNPTGNVVLGEDGTARVLTRKQVEGGGIVGERYTSHFATCPNAERHRR